MLMIQSLRSNDYYFRWDDSNFFICMQNFYLLLILIQESIVQLPCIYVAHFAVLVIHTREVTKIELYYRSVLLRPCMYARSILRWSFSFPSALIFVNPISQPQPYTMLVFPVKIFSTIFYSECSRVHLFSWRILYTSTFHCGRMSRGSKRRARPQGSETNRGRKWERRRGNAPVRIFLAMCAPMGLHKGLSIKITNPLKVFQYKNWCEFPSLSIFRSQFRFQGLWSLNFSMYIQEKLEWQFCRAIFFLKKQKSSVRSS